jgi:serine/threonine-protein kinase
MNKAVPEMLDFIVAKMLAKPVEERYKDAQETVRDLRECERQLAAAGTLPPHATLPGTTPVPHLANAHARTVLLGQSVNRDREADKAPAEIASADAPSRIAPSFDSLEATQRLASMTGAATTWAPQSATQAVSALPRPPGGNWRRRDWLLVGSAAVLGLVLAGAVVRKRD